MASIEKKRRRKEGFIASRKKLKGDKHIATAPILGSCAPIVSQEKLPWHEVPFPDTFQDAEGFFGLEELSDVDVVKHSGKIQYKLSSKSSVITSRRVVDDPSKILQYQRSKPQNGVKGEEEEWQGLEGSEPEEHGEPAQTGGNLPDRAGRKANANVSKSRQQMRGQDALAQTKFQKAGNTFDPLSKDGESDVDNEGGDTSAWESLHLSSETLMSLSRLKFVSPTTIQKSALPHILAGHDAICKAPTGSGKTLAFGIPIYEHFLKHRRTKSVSTSKHHKTQKRPPIALILSPTRELAHQLSAHLSELSSHLGAASPGIATLTGGLSVHKQQRLIATADIVIGTPGRLWEVISNSSELQESLKMIRYLVLDEADRLLSTGHFQEVEEILNALDRQNAGEDVADEKNSASSLVQGRQTLVFSATLQKDLQQRLAGKNKAASRDPSKQQSMEYLLKKVNFREEKPKFIDVNPWAQMATGLKEAIVECAGTDKDLYLYSVLLYHPNSRILIFTNSITSVRRLTALLQNLTLPAYSLHSQMPQKARLRSIERFSSPSSSSILIATDVAARGLDIPSVQLVIHYHLPRAADMYVHRSGRTARAEKSGSSILLCAPEEVQGVRRLITKVHARNASSTTNGASKSFMQTLDLDHRILTRIKPRVALSKEISDAALASEKKAHEDNWLKTAAEDLGVEYDSEEFAAGEGSKKGRGQGRKKREREARGLSKAEVGALRAELKGLLAQRVNVGVSESYLTGGGVDVDELLSGEGKGEFLGRVEDGIGEL